MNEPLITVVGNVVVDPELRTSQAGKPWVTFRVASTPRVRDRSSGNWVDGETLWLGCRAFGEMAENIANSLTKGTRVIVQGRLSSRSYTDNQGQQRTSLDLDVDSIGPELRFATAQVTRSASRGQGGSFGGGNNYGGGQQSQQPAATGWGQQQAPVQTETSAWGQQAQNDAPWGEAPSGDGFAGEEVF